MAARTVMGSAEMVLETGEHPGKLKGYGMLTREELRVAAVSALEECGFRNAVIKAADACFKKCTDMR